MGDWESLLWNDLVGCILVSGFHASSPVTTESTTKQGKGSFFRNQNCNRSATSLQQELIRETEFNKVVRTPSPALVLRCFLLRELVPWRCCDGWRWRESGRGKSGIAETGVRCDGCVWAPRREFQGDGLSGERKSSVAVGDVAPVH